MLKVEKPCVFVSHVAHEHEIASALKELIEGYFVNADVFVSSEPIDNGPGTNWPARITEKLKTCVALIVLCSYQSVKRPWVNFEAGAGWVRDIPIIPICHSGIKPSELPMPLSFMQGIRIENEKELKDMMSSIAKILDSRIPVLNLDNFMDRVRKYEQERFDELLEYYPTSRAVQARFGDLIAGAHDEIWLCGVQFAISLSDWRIEYIEALKRGVTIRAAVLDPESPNMESTAASYAMDVEELRGECQDSMNKMILLKKERDDLLKLHPHIGSIELMKYTELPRGRYYITDSTRSTGVVVVTPYLEGLRSSMSPMYIFRGNSDMAKVYVEVCCNIFKKANPV